MQDRNPWYCNALWICHIAPHAWGHRFESCCLHQTLDSTGFSRVFAFQIREVRHPAFFAKTRKAGCPKMKKISMKNSGDNNSVAEVFERFVKASLAKGVSERTVKTYRGHFKSMSRHLDIGMALNELNNDVVNSMIVSMRSSGLAHNSISSYTRVLRTFFNWCDAEGLRVPAIPKLNDKETIKDTYTDEELKALLRKPSKKARFTEYRNWVIVNLFLNSGCRAATVRNIQNRDVALESNHIISRHNKNGKVQVIPLCEVMVFVLRSYMSVRKGKDMRLLHHL